VGLHKINFNKVKYVRDHSNFSKFWNYLFFETLYQFSLSSLEICGFSPSYQILLSLFDILNAFYNNI